MHDGFVLGVDLDGVCGDYTSAFRAVVAEEQGVDASSLPLERSWDFSEWGLTPAEFQRLHHAAVLEHRMFRTMPPYPDAAEVLWRLSDAGVWIRIITHRLVVNWGHAVAVSDTVEWLDANGFPYRDICFLGRKPEIEADCYVDDGPHNVEALRATGDTVIVFDAPYNRDLDGPRARDWLEVEHLVSGLVAARGTPLQGQFPNLDEPARRLSSRIERG